MSILQRSFHLVDKDIPKIVALSREVATGLVLLSCLAPIALSDIGLPFETEIYCTDASLHKGAILKASVNEELAEVLWKTSKTKGAYTRLLSPLDEALKRIGALEEVPTYDDQASVHRPLALEFDFIEVFAGAAKISKLCRKLASG